MFFANSRMLWLLLIAVPLLTVFFWWSWRKRQKLTAQFVQSRLLANLTVGISRTALKVRMTLLVLTVATLLLALARPMWGEVSEQVRQRGLDIVVAIDTSRSMLAEDIAPNRLERAKLAALDLMKLAKNDRLGLVAFAGSAFLQCPLTLDDEAFRQSINALEVGIIPQGGTAISEAIDASLGAFKEDADNFKILVIFTDGEDHEANAEAAVDKAKNAGLHIFTVGVGTANGELLRVKDENGRSDYIKDEQGKVVKSRLNESLLKQLATSTEGFYLPMSGADTAKVLYQQGLEPLPRSESTTKMIRSHRDQFVWPLGLAIVLLLLEIFWPERKRPDQSMSPVPPSSNEELRKAVALIAVLAMTLQAVASPTSALRQYQKGDYPAAQKEFERLAEKRPEDARLHYNAGASAYQSGEYEKALKHFQSALSPDNLALQQNSYYNLGNTQFRLGESQEDPAQKSEAWEGAVSSYESSLKLNPADQDTKHNLELVKQKLEELKKQQKQDKKDNQKQDQKDKDDKDESKQDEQQQSQQDKDKDEKKDQDKSDSKEDEKKDSKQQQEKQKPEEKQDQQQSGKEEKDKDKDQQQSKSGEQPPKDDANKDKEQAQSAQQAIPGQMSKEQAEKLLNAVRAEEKAMIFQPTENKNRTRNRVFKDW